MREIAGGILADCSSSSSWAPSKRVIRVSRGKLSLSQLIGAVVGAVGLGCTEQTAIFSL